MKKCVGSKNAGLGLCVVAAGRPVAGDSSTSTTSEPSHPLPERTASVFDLTNVDRFILLAIQKSGHYMSTSGLLSLTVLSLTSIEEALETLQSHNLVKPVADGGIGRYAPVPLAEQPLFLNWEGWLTNFCSSFPPVIEGDTLGTTYLSWGVIVLSAVLAGSRDAQDIARVTCLPQAFVSCVLAMMDSREMWWSLSSYDLQQKLQQREKDLGEIDESLRGLLEEAWGECWTQEIEQILNRLRGGRQFGNCCDNWIDDLG